MSFFDRFLLTLYSLIITILLITIIPVLTGWWTNPLQVLLRAPHQVDSSIILWTSLTLLIVMGLRLFYASVRRHVSHPKAVVHELKLGQLHITLTAIEGLAKKAAYQIDGIKEVQPQIAPSSEGIDMVLKVTVTPDINIPEVSEQVQYKVKDYILEVTGITVQNVKVLVEKIYTNRPRVE